MELGLLQKMGLYSGFAVDFWYDFPFAKRQTMGPTKKRVRNEVIWVAFMSYFIFGVIGAMWHESRILNRALLKVGEEYVLILAWLGLDTS